MCLVQKHNKKFLTMDRVQALDSLIQKHSIITKLLPCLPKHLPFEWPQKKKGFIRKKERSFILTAGDFGQYPSLKETPGKQCKSKVSCPRTQENNSNKV